MARSPSPKKEMPYQSPQRLTRDALRENEGFTKSIPGVVHAGGKMPQRPLDDDTMSKITGFPGMDDTCFSAFSAVPNADMTRLVGGSPVRHESRSPEKRFIDEGPTPRPISRHAPSKYQQHGDDDVSFSPTPRRHKSSHEDSGDTTNLLVDFTDQFSTAYKTNRSPTRNGRLSPQKFSSHTDLSSYARARTPSPTKHQPARGTPGEARHLANLLDFDLTPAPTPRSIPAISARELESMKSAFLSQISSLSASLSGKEAEVKSLKDAVQNADRRAGEAQEQIRDERGAKESLQHEIADWEKRQGEMQAVLKDVKEEIIRGDREKDTLFQRVQEEQHKREDAEVRALEAESKIKGLEAGTAAGAATDAQGEGSVSNSTSNGEVEAAVTKVAKELHGLYKSKHEAKVTALKKSYSDRWEKKVKDLNTKIEELTKENEDLRIGRDATMTATMPSALGSTTSSEKETLTAAQQGEQRAEFETKLTTLQDELSTLKHCLATTRSENTHLTSQLASSRAEIADLIEASEELMQLSNHSTLSVPTNTTHGVARPLSTEPAPFHQQQSSQPNFSRSVSERSGLKAPGFGVESRIGRMGGGGVHTVSGGGSLQERGIGGGAGGYGRSGILSNIERMGRGREKE